MTPHPLPVSVRTSSLPDYFAEERRAQVRVHRQDRVRRMTRWLTLVVAGSALLLLPTAR